MRGNVIETVMGAVVLVVAAVFLYFAYSTSQYRSAAGGYELGASFERIDGIKDGSDVRIGGIKVGSVVSATLDPKTFLADVKLSVEPQFKLPDDTVAEIVSSGLLGDKYLSLVPGGSDKNLPPGGQIKYTQSSVSLEHLIGQMMFSPTEQKKGGGDAGAPGAAPPGEAAPAAPNPGPAPAPAK